MKINLSRFTTSRLTVVGTSLGILLLNANPPIKLLDFRLSTLSHQAVAQDLEEDANVRVYQTASPAVVSIKTKDGSGSGSIISADGLILTNAHVVSGSRSVQVTLADGTKLQGEVIAFGEPGLDLAAVQLQGQSNLPTIQLADPDSIAVGQRAFAIGNPFGQFQGTFTTGIVSRIDTTQGLIQTDTAINPGNSGGPLLNNRGELIGINSAIYAPRGSGGNIGIGFAIMIDRVEPFLASVADGTAPRVAQASPLIRDGQVAKQIAPNSPAVEGHLTTDSGTLEADNSYVDSYTFEGKAGQEVVIEMTSSEVDSFLILLAPDGQGLAQDDDGGGGSNARLVVTELPADGTYTVLANSYAPGETGRYNLRLATGGTNRSQ